MKRRVSLSAAALTLCLFAAALARTATPVSPPAVDSMRLPSVMLWAWERPDDLSTLDPQKVGVAFLARTIYLHRPGTGDPRNEVLLRPRQQSLRAAPGTPLMAVVRIDTGALLRPATSLKNDDSASDPADPYTGAQRKDVVAMIADAARLPGVRALQIDFDATRRERRFYAALLADVRRAIPEGVPLSITALASWCIGDPWLNDLPSGSIDEAVPMLFRMGPDAASVIRYLSSGKEFRAAACRTSFGVSTDEAFSAAFLHGEPGTGPGAGKRVYIFTPKAWTKETAEKIEREVTR